jgi:hypothetical protein
MLGSRDYACPNAPTSHEALELACWASLPLSALPRVPPSSHGNRELGPGVSLEVVVFALGSRPALNRMSAAWHPGSPVQVDEL